MNELEIKICLALNIAFVIIGGLMQARVIL